MAKHSVSGIVIQFALAIYFAVTGLCLLGAGGSTSSSEILTALSFLHINTQVVRIIFGIVLLLCGVLLVIRSFAHVSVLDTILLIVTLALWVVVTVLSTMNNIANSVNVLYLLLDLARNCLIIGGILSISF